MSGLKMVFAGDILPTRRLLDLPSSTRAVCDLVRSADISIGNFEMPLIRDGAPIQKLLNIKADPDIAADVPALGFDVLTLANNHAVDYGWPALKDTARLLVEQNLTVVGVGDDRDSAAGIAIRKVGERQVGVLAFSCLTPTGMSAGVGRPGISALHIETSYEVDPWYQMEEPGDPSAVRIRTRVRASDQAWAEEAIRSARKQCDILVVTIHWGFGSGEELAEYQYPLGKALIEAGADVIHGHHPHAVHPVGYHQGKPILFGLGTFIGQQIFLPAPPNVQTLWAGMSPDGIVAEFCLDLEGDVGVALHPTTLTADRLPIAATGEAFDRIAQRLSRLSTPYGASVVQREGALDASPLS
jgi:poly-gamma-glutamate capsule biosynthesis protein CapA/YwtB (metallophosphatase superfamily)